ncbi:MAG: hypothetical protein AAF624_00585 [Bacteroidota bacterium]
MPRSRPTRDYLTPAFEWAALVRSFGARFAVEAKAAEAVAFCVARQPRSFALPSKLSGVGAHRDTLVEIAVVDSFAPLEIDAIDQVCPVYWQGAPVGHVQPKHRRWVQRLHRTGALRLHVLAVTGGTEERPHRGLNVVFGNLTEALRLDAAVQLREQAETSDLINRFGAETEAHVLTPDWPAMKRAA